MHTVNKWRETIPTCARCGKQGQNKYKCTITKVKCNQCEADHQASSINCPKNQKRHRNHPEPNKRTHTHTKTSRTESESWINLQKRSKKTSITQLDWNPRLVLSKKVNVTQEVRTQPWLKQARLSQEFVDSRLKLTKISGEKKTHRLYRLTARGTLIRKKEKIKGAHSPHR